MSNIPFWVSKKCFGANQLWLDTMKGIEILASCLLYVNWNLENNLSNNDINDH
jgi:hypothetical protein